MIDIKERLLSWCIDWNGAPMVDGEQPRVIPRVRDLRDAAEEIAQLREALKPFAAFAEKADAFVAARAKDGGSPILPSKDFRLADFKRAAAALNIHHSTTEGGA